MEQQKVRKYNYLCKQIVFFTITRDKDATVPPATVDLLGINRYWTTPNGHAASFKSRRHDSRAVAIKCS